MMQKHRHYWLDPAGTTMAFSLTAATLRPWLDSIKVLGVRLDNKLSMKNHIKEQQRKANAKSKESKAPEGCSELFALTALTYYTQQSLPIDRKASVRTPKRVRNLQTPLENKGLAAEFKFQVWPQCILKFTASLCGLENFSKWLTHVQPRSILIWVTITFLSQA